jgi:diguanylate cyclase (GGDEF)-like protein/PAS domain S-box-containing protein
MVTPAVSSQAALESPGAVGAGQPAARVLLVDDEPRLLHSLYELLSGQGHVLTKASSGREAIDRLTHEAFDLVILDLHLPDMDGSLIMDFMNAQPNRVNVIVVSGTVEIDEAIASFRRGACDFLRKPYSRQNLFKTVDTALRQRRLQSENQLNAVRLEDSEKAHRHLLDNAPDILYTLDREGCFTFINERAQHLLGFGRDELVGQHFCALVHADDQEQARRQLSRAPDEDGTQPGVELRLRSRHSDGVERTFSNIITDPKPQAGASNPGSAGSAFAAAHGVARDITLHKRKQALLAHQAFHDPLTELPNRALFGDRLSLAMRQADRNASSLAVLFLDLDKFKRVNDTLGHVVGDQLLQQVASRLKACLRNGDTLSRLGGDEFTALLPELNARGDAAVIADKLVECLRPTFRLAGFPISISASIGISVYPSSGTSVEELIGNADVAMYHVKVNGKNGHAFYAPSMPNTRLP